MAFEMPFKEIFESRKGEYDILQDEKTELEAEFHARVWEEWSSYCRELGFPENCGLWEA
jgi:hypothetical protein